MQRLFVQFTLERWCLKYVMAKTIMACEPFVIEMTA